MNREQIQEMVVEEMKATWEWYDHNLDRGDTFYEMTADDFEQADLIEAIETRFKVSIGDDDMESLNSEEDIVNYLVKELK